MDLKNFITYYLGCECKVKGVTEKLILTGVSYDDTQKVHWAYFENTELMYAPVSEVTLVLRPVMTMTQEECLELCKQASPTAWGDYRFKKWEATIDPKSNGDSWQAYDVKNENAPYSFVVDLIDGDVMLYDDSDSDFTTIDFNYRFWYVKKGFDIFGLIKAGLAQAA